MNLAFILWGFGHFGGMERRYVRLAEHLMLRCRVMKVLVFCDRRALVQVKSFLSKSVWNNIIVFEVPNSESRLINISRALFSIGKRISLEGITHVHLVSNPGLLSFYILFYLNNRLCKSLVMVDSTYDTNSSLSSRLIGCLSLFLYSSVDCLSFQTKRVLEDSFSRIHRKKFHVAPCSFTHLGSVPVSNPIKKFDFVMMARFVPGKGYNLLESIFDSIKCLDFCCFGSGPNPPNIPSTYISFTEAPFEVLSDTKIFLSLQEVNNYPSQSVLEAMCCGAVVVATDVGETRRFLDANCSILIQNDPIELLKAIHLLLGDEKLRDKLATNAMKRVLAEHSIDRYGNYFTKYVLRIDDR
jgi:glycosyltransferase involved in cell wall biosynthesis